MGLKRPKCRIAPPAAGCRTAVTSNVDLDGASDSVEDEVEEEDVLTVPVSEGWPPP